MKTMKVTQKEEELIRLIRALSKTPELLNALEVRDNTTGVMEWIQKADRKISKEILRVLNNKNVKRLHWVVITQAARRAGKSED